MTALLLRQLSGTGPASLTYGHMDVSLAHRNDSISDDA